MPATTSVQINIDGEPPQFSVTVLDRALGAMSENLEVRLQASLKQDFHQRCRVIGCDMSERIRELMAIDTYGPDHVRTLIASRLDVIGIGAHHGAPSAVRAG